MDNSDLPNRERPTKRRSTMFHGDSEWQAGMGRIIQNSKYFRRLTIVNDLCIPFMENSLVVDNGCDQTIFNINSFLIWSFVGIQYSVGGALNSITPSTLELVNESFTLVTLTNKIKVIFQINLAFLDKDPLQTEALIQPHQIQAFGLVVYDCAHRHMGKDGKPGGQCIEFGNTKYPMYFDGWKCYFQVQKPDPTDLAKYPIVQLTSPNTYDLQCRYCCRVRQP